MPEAARPGFSRNASVPPMTISVGTGSAVSAAAARLGQILPKAVFTLERVRLCKRDGARLGEPRRVAETDESGLAIWQKLATGAGGRGNRRRRRLDHASRRPARIPCALPTTAC